MTPRTDPLTGVQQLAQRILDDSQELVEATGRSAVKILNEGVDLTHDSVQVGLDAIALAHNELGKAANKLRELRVTAPVAKDDPSAPVAQDPPADVPSTQH